MEIARSNVDEHRIGDGAVCTERELHLTAEVQVVVFVKRGIGVADLLDSLDDVVAHRQNAAVAARETNEALAR